MNRLAFPVFVLAIANTAYAQDRNSGATPQSATAEIVAMETQLWQHWKDRKFDAIDAMLAPDLVAVEAIGSYDRAQLSTMLRKAQCTVSGFKLLNTKVTPIAPGAMLITYRSESSGVCDGQKLDDAPDVNSTVWVKRNGKWLTIFHHQSPAQR